MVKSITNNQQSTTNNQQSTINNQQPTINNQQPTINNQQSTINNQQSTKNIYKLKTLYVCCTKLTGVDFYPKLKMPFRKSEIDFRQELGQASI
jgi:hypothetical protein